MKPVITNEEELLEELSCSEIDALSGKLKDKEQIADTKGKKGCPR